MKRVYDIMARILFVVTEDWALISHRLHLVKAAIAAGHNVGLATSFSLHEDMLKALGVTTFDWVLVRSSLNPFSEIASIWRLRQIIKIFQPDIVHAVAQKPVLYTGFLKRLGCRFGFVAALGGVGFIFESSSLKAKLLRPLISKLLKFCLTGENTKFILQNPDNIRLFESLGIVKKGFAKLIRGSGVELDHFKVTELPDCSPIVILPARMLWDKGVAEFVNAAKSIKAKNINAEFVLVGDIDKHNPAMVSQGQIDEWVSQKIVSHWERQNDMALVYSKTTITCLPSYHEGLPKVLLEAASCGRPIVAFDVAGSREIVDNGTNGFLVPFKDQDKLEDVLITLISDRQLCEKMGRAGRRMVEAEFSDRRVNRQTFKIWYEVI